MNPLDVLIWAGTIAAVVILAVLTIAVAVGAVKSMRKPKEEKSSATRIL